MTQVESAPNVRRAKVNWYKWATGVIVPLLVAAFGMFKLAGGGKEQSTPNNFVLVTDITVIENQYQQATGKTLTDPALTQQVQSAVNLAKAGELDASRKAFEDLASKVPVPAVFSNIAAIAADRGDLAAARQNIQQALAKDPDYKPARENQQSLVRAEAPHPTEANGQEIEPNSDFNHVNVIAVGAKIAGAIADANDVDYFQIKTGSGPRDIFHALVGNGSTTLHPAVSVFDGNRHEICTSASDEALATLECRFSADPDSTYFAAVQARYGNIGAYTFSMEALKQFDRYEPNDDPLHATPLALGARLDAAIMDNADTDFFVVKSAGAGQLTAHLENRSTTLHPSLAVTDGNRHEIASTSSDEAVAVLDLPFTATAQSTYYIQVGQRYNNVGAYTISVK